MGRFHTRGQKNCLDRQIVLRRTNRYCLSDVTTGRTNFWTNKLSDIWLSVKMIFPDDLSVKTNKSMTVRHKFTSDGQMHVQFVRPDDLFVL